MTVVIDTNVLLQMLSTRHSFHVILEAWSKGQFTWALSNESLLEYEELAVPRVGLLRWREFMKAMELVDTIHRNVRHISPTFRFHLPHSDPDDQKFADCAIAAERTTSSPAITTSTRSGIPVTSLSRSHRRNSYSGICSRESHSFHPRTLQ